MSDTVSKSDYDRLQNQFMTLQREAETLRKQPTPAQVMQSVILNAKAAFKQYGYGDDVVEHVRTGLIVDKLGPNAPLQMQMSANQGPMLMQVQELANLVKTLADKVDNTATSHTQYTEREKFKSIISNASKDSYLAKAYAKNPEKVVSEMASQAGTAEAFIAKKEAELKEIAETLGIASAAPAPDSAAAASENAGKQGEGKNTTIASAQSGLLNDVPVPKPGTPPGVWNKDTYAAVKEKLLADAAKGNR